jgi:serine/threonine protein kinase
VLKQLPSSGYLVHMLGSGKLMDTPFILFPLLQPVHGVVHPPELLASWVQRLVPSLQILHSSGHVHRDIKPANLLVEVGDKSKIYLADFGVAQKISSNGCFRGTPAYASASAYASERYTTADDFEALCWTFYQFETGKVWSNPDIRPPLASVQGSSFILRFISNLCKSHLHGVSSIATTHYCQTCGGALRKRFKCHHCKRVIHKKCSKSRRRILCLFCRSAK